MTIFVPAALLLFACLCISGFFVYEATTRTITNVEGALFQVFALATGLVGSFIFGRQSARAAAREMIKPHARSAFRRLTSLYKGLSRISVIIEQAHNLRSDSKQRMAALERIDEVVIAHLITADDAIQDWWDIVPEDVEGLKQQLSASSSDEG